MDLVAIWQLMIAPYLRAKLGATPAGRTERGASLVEYALLVALIAVVAIIAIRFIGSGASKNLSESGSALQ